VLILENYIDFLVQKLKENPSNPLDALSAFIVAWACTDSTNPLSITLRRMLGLPYVGNVGEAFNMIFARINSDSAFRGKVIESLILAIEREWIRKNLIEAAWKNASKELHQAIKDLYETRRMYTIKMFLEEVERVIMAKEEKTFETMPPPMSVAEKEILPAPPKEEEVKEIAKVEEISREEASLDALLEYFDTLRDSLDKVSNGISLLTNEVKELKEHLHAIKEALTSMPTILQENVEKILMSIKDALSSLSALRPPPAEEKPAPPAIEEKAVEVPPAKTEEIRIERKEEASSLMEELEKTLSEEEIPVTQKTVQYYFLCLGNLNRIGELLTERSVPGYNLRWSLRIQRNDTVYEIILQGLYRDIPEEVFSEVINNGKGLLVAFPIKNVEALQGVITRLITLMPEAQFLILDSDTPVLDLEKITGVKIILYKIGELEDLERLFKDRIVPVLET